MKKSSKNDKPHIHYFNMGPWPGFVGFTTNTKAFNREMKRLKCGEQAFISNEHSHATTHVLRNSNGAMTLIITIGKKTKSRTIEAYAALIAHECMHVVEHMRDDLSQGRSLGSEAEAYLMQMLVQECLQIALNSKYERRTRPK